MSGRVLFEDDFSGFPIGEFPYDRDHSAMGEYHLVVEKGEHGGWTDPVCNFTYNGTGPSWIITEEDKTHYMESMRIEKGHPHRMFPTLMAGSRFWKDYCVSVKVKRLSTKGMAGIAFAMQNSLNTLVFQLEKDRASLVYRHKEEVMVLKDAAFVSGCDREYALIVKILGSRVVCMVDQEPVISFSWDRIAEGGRIALTADCPTRFGAVRVWADEDACRAIEEEERKEREREFYAAKELPAMRLWKKIDLKGFGAARQMRFGHLLGDGSWQLVFAQAQRRVSRDAYGHISCLTAFDLDGNVLWQLGEPSKQADKLGKIAADLPFQIYDIDGDGFDEVIVGINFEIRILDGRTGKVKQKARTPLSTEDDASIIGAPGRIYAFDRVNPDGIRIANVSGKDRPSDIIIKDRYCRLYALDSGLNLLWKYQSSKNTGHYPFAVDINRDGFDEVLCGYTLLDHEGKELWSYPIESDHTDEIVAGRFMAGSEAGHFACASGSEGFFIGDYEGNILVRDRIGHAQRISTANYLPDREGFELAVSNFWGHQGILYLYDCYGNPIWEYENGLNGNLLTPVNWKGDGSELILLNADPSRGGLLDGKRVRALSFPDDGHPTLCCEAADLYGDERDELLVWDYNWLYIYTQEDNPREQSYRPVKYPCYNASNYRGEYAYPDTSYLP